MFTQIFTKPNLTMLAAQDNIEGQILYHYTDQTGASLIDSSSEINPTPAWGQFPQGAYGTDISPMNTTYSQTGIVSMFNLQHWAGWVVAFSDSDNVFHNDIQNYPDHFVARSTTPVHIHVLLTAINPMR